MTCQSCPSSTSDGRSNLQPVTLAVSKHDQAHNLPRSHHIFTWPVARGVGKMGPGARCRPLDSRRLQTETLGIDAAVPESYYFILIKRLQICPAKHSSATQSPDRFPANCPTGGGWRVGGDHPELGSCHRVSPHRPHVGIFDGEAWHKRGQGPMTSALTKSPLFLLPRPSEFRQRPHQSQNARSCSPRPQQTQHHVSAH